LHKSTGFDHIVFDIGNVLIDWDPERPFKHLIPDEKERDYFLKHICNEAWNVEQDRVRSWEEAEEVAINSHPDWAPMIRAYRKHWIETIAGPIPGGFELRDDLARAGYHLTALSNFAAATFAEISCHYPELLCFEGLTISAHIGLIKPDPAIYHHHSTAFGLDPAKTVFIDDSPANVEGAKGCGWLAIQFVTAEQTRNDLALLLS